MTSVQILALEKIKRGKYFNGKIYGEFVYVGGQKYQVAGKQGRATINEFLAAAKEAQTGDTGLGYFGTAADAKRGFDGIETI